MVGGPETVESPGHTEDRPASESCCADVAHVIEPGGPGNAGNLRFSYWAASRSGGVLTEGIVWRALRYSASSSSAFPLPGGHAGTIACPGRETGHAGSSAERFRVGIGGMDLGLHNRVYLVTGGSRGLGFAAAEALIAEGARIVLSSPREATASAAAGRLVQNLAAGGDVTWVAADNADPATPGLLIEAARERFSRLDGALISAGGTPPGTIASTRDEDWRSAFESVFLGAVRLARVLAADLADRSEDDAASGFTTGMGGSIVLVLAASVRVPLNGLPISNGLFPGLAGVIKMLAGEFGPSGIRINGLLPVRIATDRVREFDALSGDPDEVRARQSELIPLRRYGEPDEFARAAAFLLSPAASYISGAMIPIDGGAIPSI